MAVYGLYQHRHVLGRGELADAVAQVEDVRGTPAFADVRRAKAVEHGTRFGSHLLRRGAWRPTLPPMACGLR